MTNKILRYSAIQQVVLRRTWLIPSIFVFVLLVDLSYSFYRLMNLNAGGDSQWYGATLFWSGVNPYTACLESTEWFMTAFPNYAHFLYILLFPLTFFEWESAKVVWFVLSVVGFLYALFVFVRKEQVPLNFVLFPATLLLLGSTLTNALYQGQISVIMFVCTALAWVYRKNSILLVLLLSVIFTKYSFGLAILYGFFLAGYRKESVIAFGINLLSALVFAIKFDMGFLETLKLPFEVASRYTSFGHSDLVSLFRTTNPEDTVFGLNYFSVLAGLVYLVYTYLCVRLRPSNKAIVVSSILLSFSLFFHLDYDYTALLAPILISLSAVRLSKVNLLLLVSMAAYFWLYPMIPKLLRTFFDMDTGLLPVEWFGPTLGTLFIALNTVMITVIAFRVLLDKALNSVPSPTVNPTT